LTVLLALSTNGALELTAYATLALAFVTGALSITTFLSVRVSKSALTQTRQEIAVSRAEVEEAHRPVLVPVAEPTAEITLAPNGPYPVVPIFVNAGVLIVPVRNIGSGPALDIEAWIELLSDEDLPAAVPQQRRARHVGIGVSQLVPLEIRLSGWGTSISTPVPSLAVHLAYDDVGGKSWRTSAIYLEQDHRFDAISIRAQQRRRPTSDMD
jgi:hypothetical protein